MAISIQDIAKLRKMSGAGLTDCKHALEETNGDFDKAMEIIRAKGKAVAAKRSDREAAEGCVLADHATGFAAIVSLQCETDFMAKQPENKEALLALTLADGRTVADHITDRTGTTGEKMELGAYEFVKAEHTISYIHPGNKLAVVAAFNEAVDQEMARMTAMQIASMNPVAVREEEVPQEVVERELKIAREKALEEGKKPELIDRIAQGALQKYYKENTLLRQAFISDGKMDVEAYLKTASKTLTVNAFRRVTLNAE